MDWEKESTMFDRAAEYYDTFRPGYPDGIIRTLVRETGIGETSRLLEIGAGSGKATALLAPFRCSILCIEPGHDLAEKGRLNFRDRHGIEFREARFEDCDVPDEHFDVLFAAQSFHWVPQPAGFVKSAKALKRRGHLALMWNMYITYPNDLDTELLQLSGKYGGFADFLSESECEDRIVSIQAQIEGSGLFERPAIHRQLWNRRYTADDYFGFLLTGNRFLQKPLPEKQAAYEDLVRLCCRHGGAIDRPYLCVLYIAGKK